jgi:hypothetical protein
MLMCRRLAVTALVETPVATVLLHRKGMMTAGWMTEPAPQMSPR